MAMSDAGAHRRQPPSPLVFSPVHVHSPIPLQAQSSNASSSHGSGTNTVSMPFVRRHVTRRLKAAKGECDKELQRVTNNVTAFFEERLREGDQDNDQRDHRDRAGDRDRDSQLGDHDHLREPFTFHTGELGLPSHSDEYSSDGGYEPEPDFYRHSRQPSSQTSPGSFRRQMGHGEKPTNSSVSSVVGSSPASSTILLPEAGLGRRQAVVSPAPTWGSGVSSRRLSRSVHKPSRPSASGQSSRSTSRSRSPLPPTSSHASFSELGSTVNRRQSRMFVDDPVDPLMGALYELIAVATDVTDMSVAHLMGNPKICESIVQRVQNIGKAWDEHSDWPGRNWYVQVLLAVASLSRVVEWWEAEKQFWNFDEQADEQDEPLMFVMKPADEEAANLDMELEGFRLDDKPPSPALQRPKEEPLSTTPAPSPLPPQEVSAPTSSRATPQQEVAATESARVLATERLRLQAETAQNQNIVIELSLDGDHFIWVNHAWRVVVGTDPEGLPGTRISSLLAASDWGVFKEATNRLQEDDSHTVEVRFKLQTEPSVQKDPSAGSLYQLMEGKGMLMIDREDGQPSHTMWVVRPLAPARFENDTSSIVLEADDLAPEPASTIKQSFLDRSYTEPATPFPFSEPIVTDAILCRICESQIPQWYFEKHSETCAETHRLEAEIMECNESISELRNAIRDLCTGIDRSSPSVAPEYRGLPVFIPSSSPLMTSPLQLFRANKLQRFSVKRMQRRFLDQVDDILQACLEISVPSLKEEEAKEPIERQRLLSPTSERKITQVRNWAKPTTEDAALGQLLQDAERVMRQKIDSVVRMQNTIRYAEKIWTEWEERIQNYLGTIPESSDSGSESSEGNPEEIIVESPPISRRERTFSEATTVDDHSSTTSEYNFGRDVCPREPSPASCLSPIPFITSPTEIKPMSNISSVTSPLSPPPAHYHGHSHSPPLAVPQSSVVTFGPRTQQLTRASTPSSVSSPLARAPIIAAMDDNATDDAVPSMSLDDAPESTSTLTLKTRKSNQSLLEPKFVVTPPASPQVAGRDVSSGSGLQRESSTTRRGSRRHSTATLLTSPTAAGPLSPRQASGIPLPRANPTSIKDFEIIKPISKGAFGSVFLAKKKVTGDYYAIKVLKKADMIAKNQITNVKAERMILMKQAESPFVAKLYFTFQSKENLYLVMEYLNGGDCAALIKSLGCLPEEWTKNYIAEVVLGLEYLHQRGIVHRDLKPDNLLIDQHGHLKLTDFGLSRIGLLGRQTRDTQFGRALGRYGSRSRPPSMDSAYFSSPLVFDPSGGSYFTQRPASVSRVGNSPHLPPADDAGEGSASEMLAGFQARRSGRMSDSPLQSFATELTTDLRSHSSNATGTTPPGEQKFVGTPDYLAPETILGLRGDDAAVDWWALGVITYEFLYGIPPFHADSPEKLFENILSGVIEWHDDWVDYSPEARDFMQSLMHIDPNERLGSRGADEVKAHPWFEGIDWDNVTATEAAFIPQVSDPESTDYFDPRGAIPQLFHEDEDFVALTSRSQTESPANNMPPPSAPVPIAGKEMPNSAGSDDFGSFSFKNLPVLKQANDDVIRKIKTDQMAPMTHTLSEPVTNYHQRKRSISQRIKKPPNVVTTMDPKMMSTNPPSPATSTSSIASSPSRTSLPPSTPGSVGVMGGHSRKPSEYGAVERFKFNHMEGDRRNSMPSRLRTASVSSAGDGSGSETWNSSTGGGGSQPEASTPASSVHSIDLRKAPDPSDRVVTCLLAEDNPITAKIIETLLVRLGCRVIVVADGSEAISVAMGDIKFDCILMDLQMPVLDGEGAARYIKSTNGKNTNTPIIAVSAYSGTDPSETNNAFDAALSKPLQRADLLNVFRQLGFKTTPKQVVGAAKVTPSTSQLAQPLLVHDRANDRTVPVNAYPSVVGQHPQTINREDAMFMTRTGASNTPSMYLNQSHNPVSAQLYPTHIQAYGSPQPPRGPATNTQEPYYAAQTPYQNVVHRTQTLPPLGPGRRNPSRPRTAPNRDHPPQSQGGFYRADDSTPISSGYHPAVQHHNDHTIPAVPNRLDVSSPRPPIYPPPHSNPNEWAHGAQGMMTSPQQMDSPTPLPHQSNYRPNPYIQRPRQGSLPPMHRPYDPQGRGPSVAAPAEQVPNPHLPPQDLLLSHQARPDMAANPYTHPQHAETLHHDSVHQTTVPNPYLHPQQQQPSLASHPQPPHNPYLHGQGPNPEASGHSGPYPPFQRPPDALVPGIPPPLPAPVSHLEQALPQPPAGGPSPEEEEEFAKALALSQSEEAERKRLQDELLQQEEDDLARALAESMLSTGTDLYGAGTNPFFVEPNEIASSSKFTLDSPAPSKSDPPAMAFPDWSPSNAPTPKLDALPDLDSKITGFDDLGSQNPDVPQGNGSLGRDISHLASGTNEPPSYVREQASNMTPPPALGLVTAPESMALSISQGTLGDEQHNSSGSTSQRDATRSHVDIPNDRPESPSELAYYRDESPMPSPLPVQSTLAAAPIPSTDNQPEPPFEPPPPEYSPPSQSLPSVSPVDYQSEAANAYANNQAMPAIMATQSPPQLPRSLSDVSHSPLSTTHSVPTGNPEPLGVPFASSVSLPPEENARGPVGANQFIDADLLLGVSISFENPVMSDKLKPMENAIPNIVSLPYGRCPPLHIQAPSWKHMLKLLARMSSTRFEPTVQAQAITKAALKLRTVVQFVKPLDNYPYWRTILWFKIDYPVPNDLPDAQKWTTSNPNMLPFAFTLNTLPRILQNATDGPVSKTYTIPATETMPYPTLPISCPNLAIYLQAVLDFSRGHKDDNSGFKKLAKMVNSCYPSRGEDTGLEGPDKNTVGGLFKRVIGRKDKKGKGKSNNETYEFITPFVPDEWG